MTQEADMEEKQATVIARHTDLSAVLARLDQLDSKFDTKFDLLRSELNSKIDLLRSELASELNRSIAQRVTVPLYLVLVAGIVALVVSAF